MRYDSPKDIARRMGANSARRSTARRDSYRRETFALPREAAREKARELFRRYPKAAYMTAIESWRELPDGAIEFTMRRLPPPTDASTASFLGVGPAITAFRFR